LELIDEITTSYFIKRIENILTFECIKTVANKKYSAFGR